MLWIKCLIIWIKALFVDEVVEEAQTIVYTTCKEPTPRPLSYWSEFAAQLRPAPSVELVNDDEAKQEAIRLYKENNKMLNDYFRKRQSQSA